MELRTAGDIIAALSDIPPDTVVVFEDEDTGNVGHVSAATMNVKTGKMEITVSMVDESEYEEVFELEHEEEDA